jgi:small subunit ribosomal protein S5
MPEIKKKTSPSFDRKKKDEAGSDKDGRKPMRKNRKPKRDETGLAEDFEQRIIDIARVTRVMAGGKRMRFRACVAIGNKKGSLGIGLAKGADVTLAVTKAVNQAKKSLINVPIVNDTIPHEIYHKKGAAKILLKPAKKGRGVIAGGAVRAMLELSGIKNITGKILGTNNKVNNVKCAIEALDALRKGTKPKKADNSKMEDSVIEPEKAPENKD